ncbi:MAG: hypothetical protein IKM29_02435 [Clostridia bacterium]|nr:hypothetical protein [Clostridia bacterium]
MNFFTSASEKRPVYLCEETRKFAYESMHGKYGDEAMKAYAVVLDGVLGFEEMEPLDKYDTAIKLIAQNAPLRLCEGERVVGAATLGLAIGHMVPVTYKGEAVLGGVSHLTLNFETLLKKGLRGYRKEIAARQSLYATERQRRFLQSLAAAEEAFEIWHGRYLELTKTENPRAHGILKKVPVAPAETFEEAVQTLWMEFAFARLCGIWPGIGRIDVLLGEYLKKDLEAGVVDLNEAREILASLFIKGCEWIRSSPEVGSGDAQHYQNIVLAGVDENGCEVTNEVTYLVLDIVEELGISDFPITVRVNENSPKKLLRRVAEVMRHGGGVVAVYNEPLILRSLKNAGYSDAEASRFANDGCWEVQIPGKTNFGYIPFDGLRVFERAFGLGGETEENFRSIEDLYSNFLIELKKEVEGIYRSAVESAYYCENGKWYTHWNDPASVVSLFEDDCIALAASYYDFGTRYTLRSPHIGGAPDVANSLAAIEELVFRRKAVSIERLREILKNNWEGEEELRLTAKNGIKYYGNDSEAADAFMARILNDFADVVCAVDKEHADCPVSFIPGVSTFGRQIEWRYVRHATAFGYRRGEILSGNASPTPGTDAAGLTSVIRSYTGADLSRQTSGAALDLRIAGSALAGEQGIEALIGLIRAFVRLGGFFLQIDTVSAETLRAAVENPEMFKTLSVRVSGWNARFVTLNREWQEMIINRTEQSV